MKITHICLNGPVTDNWSYQDNLLPKYHKAIGYEVSVITSQFVWNDKGKLDIDNRTLYYNEYGIKTIRIESKYNTTVHSKFKIYRNLYRKICGEKPDIIFIHGCQFLDIKYVVKYVRQNPNIKVYVDNHADLINSARSWISKNILHKIIWRKCAQIIEPYTIKFYGVLPARVEFLKNIYKLPPKKVELLVMGADEDKINFKQKDKIRQNIRNDLNIGLGDFVIVTGGKIDEWKNIHLLMEAVNRIGEDKIKLIVFGKPTAQMKNKIKELSNYKFIRNIGWIESDKCYDYFLAADLAFFPGTHSVLWEQAVGTGIPCVFKYWKGITHIDVGGNCKFLYKDDIVEIKNILIDIITDKSLYKNMKKVASEIGVSKFSYRKIAQESIDL